MKKFLLTAVLILAVVVSLTAGTMASYKTSTTLESAQMEAKSFSWDVQKSKTFSANTAIKLAPGDSQDFSVRIDNTGDTPMKISESAALGGDLSSQLEVRLVKAVDRNNVAVNLSDFIFVTGDTLTLTYTVSWSYDEGDNDNEFMEKTATLTLNLGGTQHNRSFTHGDGGI